MLNKNNNNNLSNIVNDRTGPICVCVCVFMDLCDRKSTFFFSHLFICKMDEKKQIVIPSALYSGNAK